MRCSYVRVLIRVSAICTSKRNSSPLGETPKSLFLQEPGVVDWETGLSCEGKDYVSKGITGLHNILSVRELRETRSETVTLTA
jgi:hypothetical protein